jgi:peptidoglycan/LPS O-acetylase OafA/YrhL
MVRVPLASEGHVQCDAAHSVADFSLASGFALATAALGVWLAKAHELALVFAACSAVAFLLFVCSRNCPAPGDDARGTYIRRCADALGRESYGIYLWHFVCI